MSTLLLLLLLPLLLLLLMHTSVPQRCRIDVHNAAVQTACTFATNASLQLYYYFYGMCSIKMQLLPVQ
jgi:hypothetical protein